MARRVNKRVIGGLVLLLLLVGGGLYLAHEFQTRGHADFWLDQARQAVDEEKYLEADNNYNKYLNLNPDDDAVLEEYALFCAKVGRADQASEILQRLLGRDSGRSDLRRKLVDLLLQQGQFGEAKHHLTDFLLKEAPEDAELWGRLAQAQSSLGELDEAVGSWQKAIDLAPDRIDWYVDLAKMLRSKFRDDPDKAVEADKWMGLMISRNKNSPKANATYAAYVKQYGAGGPGKEQPVPPLPGIPEEAVAALRQAIDEQQWADVLEHAGQAEQAAPGNVPALVYMSVAERQLARQSERAKDSAAAKKHAAQADDYRRQAIEKNAVIAAGIEAEVHGRLAEKELAKKEPDKQRQLGHLDDAIAAVQAAVEVVPNNRQLKWLLGRIHAEKAVALKPDDVAARIEAARFAIEASQWDRARQHLRRALKTDPKTVRAYVMLAVIDQRVGKHDEAIERYREGLKAVPADEDLLWKLTRLFIELGRKDEAAQTVVELRKTSIPKVLADYLDARLAMLNDRWEEARQHLNRIRIQRKALDDAERGKPGLPRWSQLLPEQEIDLWLGVCNGRLGNLEEQLNAFQRAIAADPTWPQPRLAKAAALLSLGHRDEAISEQKTVVSLPGAPPEALLALIDMMTRRNQRRPKEKQDWEEVDTLLALAQKRFRGSALVLQLTLNAWLARGNLSAAEQLVRKVRENNAEHLGLWLWLAEIVQRQGRLDEADQILSEAQQKLGDSVPLRVARANLLVARDRSKAAQPLRKLADDADKFPENQRLVLWQKLVGPSVIAGDLEHAEALCQRVAAAQPDNLAIRVTAFDLALERGDEGQVERWLGEIQRADKKGFAFRYAQAAKLLVEAGGVEDRQRKAELLARAGKLVAEARQLRPSWSVLPRLAGRIDDLSGNEEAALANYLEAERLGSRQPAMIRRLAGLLAEQGRFDEANQAITQLQDVAGALSGPLGWMASGILYDMADFERSLQTAEQSASQSSDYRDHLWLGRFREIIARRAEAEQKSDQAEKLYQQAEAAYRRARELAADEPGPWLALIQLLARTGRREQAEAELNDGRQKIDARRLPLVVAWAYLFVGKPDEALSRCREVLNSAPDDLRVARAAAALCRRIGRLDLAREQLQRIVDGRLEADEQVTVAARRELASLLLVQGSQENRHAALELVEKNLASKAADDQDRRLRALVLAASPGQEGRRKAIQTLEQIVHGPRQPTADERLILARLYLADGRWEDARALFLNLIAEYSDQTQYVGEYIEALLDHGETAGANQWLETLQKFAPDDPDTAILAARVMYHRGQYDEAVAKLESLLDVPEGAHGMRNARLLAVAGQLEDLAHRTPKADPPPDSQRLLDEAEKLLREAAEDSKPQQLKLAAFLARRGKVGEALDLAQPAWKSSAPRDVLDTLGALMQSAPPQSPEARRLESLIDAALEDFGRPIGLLMALANYRSRQHRFDEEEALYREILAGDVQVASFSAGAKNNLAVLLALSGKNPEEALRLANESIESLGPAPALLDTRGIAYLANGNAEKALADLETAVAERPKPIRHFHLARALKQLNRDQEAAKEFQAALQQGLKPEDLHALEVDEFESLKAQWPAPAKSAPTPKESAATPEESAATPKESAATPEESAATPKESAATPKESAATPKE